VLEIIDLFKTAFFRLVGISRAEKGESALKGRCSKCLKSLGIENKVDKVHFFVV